MADNIGSQIRSIPIEREERDDIAKVKSPNLRWERSRKL